MAVATLPTGNDAVEKLKEEITCPMCLEIYREPKILPCHHVYCKSPCLESLARKNADRTVSCPECRSVAQIPDNDVSKFPSAFSANRLIEVIENMEANVNQNTKGMESSQAKKEGDRTVNTKHSKPSPFLCKIHPGECADLYCTTCEQVICLKCTETGHPHSDHHCDTVENATHSLREAVLKNLETVIQMKTTIRQSVAKVSQTKREMEGERLEVARKIEDAFDRLFLTLQEEKQRLFLSAAQLSHPKVTSTAAQVKSLQLSLEELDNTVTSIQSVVKESSNEEFLTRKESLLALIKEAATKFSGLQLEPVEKARDIALQVMTPEHLTALCKEHNSISRPVCPSQCTAEGVEENAEVNMVSTFRVILADSCGNLCTAVSTGDTTVAAELKAEKFGSITKAQVSSKQSSSYEISFKPDVYTRGRCELSVKVNEQHISCSPFSVYVRCPPSELGSVVRVIDTPCCPAGLAINPQGYLYVSMIAGPLSGSSVVKVFDNSFTKVQTILLPGRKWAPGEIAFDKSSNIYISDAVNNQVHKFYKGVYVKSGGGTGKEPGKFRTPNGMAFSRDEALYICDSDNHRIQVFTTDLGLLKCFGEQGSKPGRFSWPNTIAFDNQDYIYVSDMKNSRIQVLNQNGESIRTFTTNWYGHKVSPNCICVAGDMIYSTVYTGNLVCVYDKTGPFVATFGKKILKNPDGIVLDDNGFVYVADSDNNRVIVF